MITESSASTGSVSHPIRVVIRPARYSVQFSTLNVGSNIHFQAKVDSTVGMMNGRSIAARTSRLPLKCRFNRSASHMPSTSLPTVATPVYTNVL
jgi:hypothetical protein